MSALIGIPCIIFLLYCLTPKGKRWLRVNGMLCPSYLSIYQFIFFSRLSGSRYHKEGGPESHGERMAALLFSPSQPATLKFPQKPQECREIVVSLQP